MTNSACRIGIAQRGVAYNRLLVLAYRGDIVGDENITYAGYTL
jgi:hypothetical protein